MGIEENKALIRKVYDELNKGNFDVIDEYYDDHFIRYTVSGAIQNRDETKKFLRNVSLRFPDIHRSIDWIVAEEDNVAFCFTWTGTQTGEVEGSPPPTGKNVSVEECYYCRFNNGRITEYKQYSDQLGFLYQLGVTPPPPPDKTGK